MPANNLLLREKKVLLEEQGLGVCIPESSGLCLHTLVLNRVQANVLGTEWVKILIDLKEANGINS